MFSTALAPNLYGLQRMKTYNREVEFEDYETLETELTIGGGLINLGKCSWDLLFSLNLKYNAEEMKPKMEFDDYEDAYLNFRVINKKNVEYDLDFGDDDEDNLSFGINTLKKTTWDLTFSDRIPIDFTIMAGAVSANLDFTGLKVNNLEIATGASRISVRFDEQNPIMMERFELTLGLAKFKSSNLLYANFEQMVIEGGVGTSILDLTGDLDHTAYVDIEMGFGSTTLILPRNVGVKLITDVSFLTSIDIEDMLETDDDEFISSNWGDTEGELVINLEATVGIVNIIFEN